MIKPSIHLTWKELACKDGVPYPNEWRWNRLIKLAQAFEIIRTNCDNLPITILSAYRTPEWNKKIGGAKHSQHLQGRALDLKPPIGWTIDRFYNEIKKLAIPQIKGIGKYKTFVHIDIRESNKIIYWFGTGVKDS